MRFYEKEELTWLGHIKIWTTRDAPRGYWIGYRQKNGNGEEAGGMMWRRQLCLKRPGTIYVLGQRDLVIGD